MKMKSVMAGRVDGAAGAGAHDGGDLGHDAGGQRVAQEDVGVAAEADDAFLDAGAAGVVQADDRARRSSCAMSMILQIFSAWASLRLPPKTVKSWLKT